jgi:hypothetical protein
MQTTTTEGTAMHTKIEVVISGPHDNAMFFAWLDDSEGLRQLQNDVKDTIKKNERYAAATRDEE